MLHLHNIIYYTIYTLVVMATKKHPFQICITTRQPVIIKDEISGTQKET